MGKYTVVKANLVCPYTHRRFIALEYTENGQYWRPAQAIAYVKRRFKAFLGKRGRDVFADLKWSVEPNGEILTVHAMRSEPWHHKDTIFDPCKMASVRSWETPTVKEINRSTESGWGRMPYVDRTDKARSV